MQVHCKFDGAVYPCPKGSVTEFCSGAAAGAQPLQRPHDEPTGVECNRPGTRGGDAGRLAEPCDEAKWDCLAGPCAAYRKAWELCAATLEQQAYSCFYLLGDPQQGVRKQKTSFPYIWLFFGFCSLALCIPGGICVCLSMIMDCACIGLKDCRRIAALNPL